MGDVADAHPSQLPAGGTAQTCCLVWTIDLSGVERPREARRILRSGAAEALASSRFYGDLRHLIITYRKAGVRRRALRSTAQSIARRLHSEFERARGRYVDVVVIDLSGIDSQSLLPQRIEELASTGRGIVGYAAIPWEDLRGESIRDTCTREVI
ncbi:hypothetical protein [Microbacterium sp. NPDC087665]|uniref:hypothetical protein n=1 Tax=Microbacterium sp. NPDC087665 TaxID=3364194 RepID=UPI00381889B4